MESFQIQPLRQTPHSLLPCLRLITPKLSILSLPRPHSYMPYQPPASQLLSLIIQIYSWLPAHTMLGQASVILIILFTCLGIYFSLSIGSSSHPPRSSANPSRRTLVNFEVELDVPNCPVFQQQSTYFTLRNNYVFSPAGLQLFILIPNCVLFTWTFLDPSTAPGT